MSRRRAGPAKTLSDKIENDNTHHLVGDLSPQTPLNNSPRRSPVSIPPPRPVPLWLRWAVVPTASLKTLSIPIFLHLVFQIVAPRVSPDIPNPFGHFFLLSGLIQDSSPNDLRYRKTYWDLLFVGYCLVFFSLVRAIIVTHLSPRVARYFGLRKPAKLVRFGEQAYNLVYFSVTSVWGYSIMRQLPTFWFRTEYFWIDYPHWDMMPQMKRYYLMQFSYWLHQLLVVFLGLEKPRKDYYEIVAHHFVTLWLIGSSYVINMTYIGNAVFVSMDIPEVFFAFSKLLNYIQWNTAKTYSFAVFIVVWTYCRHYLNARMQISVIKEFHLVPTEAQQWNPSAGTWMGPGQKLHTSVLLFLLHCLNAFWSFLIWRVLIRALTQSDLDDERSDDEGDSGDEMDGED